MLWTRALAQKMVEATLTLDGVLPPPVRERRIARRHAAHVERRAATGAAARLGAAVKRQRATRRPAERSARSFERLVRVRVERLVTTTQCSAPTRVAPRARPRARARGPGS